MKLDNYPIVETGFRELNGEVYYYIISQPSVDLFGIKFIEMWNQEGEYKILLYFPEHSIEERLQRAF